MANESSNNASEAEYWEILKAVIFHKLNYLTAIL